MNIVAGLHDVRLALERTPSEIGEVLVDVKRNDKRMHQLMELAEKRGVSLRRVERGDLDRLAGEVRHQGVLAQLNTNAAATPVSLESLIQDLEHDPLVLVLDGVQDPHNLGACLRSADAAGVDAVVIPGDRACGVTPVVSKVSAGAIHSLPLYTVTNLARTLESLKRLGLWIVGASDGASDNMWRTELSGPCALVLGSEDRGIRQLTRKHCDRIISIPMAGMVESLNVSVAAGVLLFEIRRQRSL